MGQLLKMKYYCWDCHHFLNEDELESCKKNNHEIDEYPDDFDPMVGRKKNESAEE